MTVSPVDIVAGLFWVTVGYKFPALLRRRHDPVTRYHWLELCLIALVLTLLTPPIYRAIDRTVGYPNVTRVLGDGLGLAVGWAVQASLFHLSYPTRQALARVRSTGLVLAAALLLLVACFALAPAAPEDPDFTGDYGHVPAMVAYRLIFLAGLAAAMSNFARLSWRYARLTPRPALQLGLRLDAVASSIGLGYVANEVLRLVPPALGRPDPIPDPAAISRLLIATFLGLGLVGLTVPAWGPRLGLGAIMDRVHLYRSYRRLYPLWHAVSRAFPAITLFPPASPLVERLSWGDLPMRRYRRVVEIRDGWLLLRPFDDKRAAPCARRHCAQAGVPEQETRAVIEAARLAVALRIHALGGPAEGAAPHWMPPGGLDAPTEIAALECVADCFRRSPLVRAVLTELGDAPGDPLPPRPATESQ